MEELCSEWTAGVPLWGVVVAVHWRTRLQRLGWLRTDAHPRQAFCESLPPQPPGHLIRNTGIDDDRSWTLKLLGLSTQAGASVTLTAIREAYKTKAREAHPDSGGSTDSMRRLNEAYRLLRELYRKT